ncbi:MAG: RNA methyltransferase [Cyanobacteria bacterium CRU_2_1]|nr:RNA methyltransferase [Cyanobacteria bacterium RU_5_0]NJR62113.1 RNA methyltransferase [Cyanobacteria bacterium CRU_2_1]
METGLTRIRIVLVEPAGSLNLGSVARVMKNMGLSQLILVNPQCDRLSPEARQMAVHAMDVLEAAQAVKSLPEALQGCQRAIATTGRPHTTLNITLEHPRTALPWLLEGNFVSEAHFSSALIFGREDRGLTNEELNYAQRLIQIPANPLYPYLNLAQAVAICCYELHESARELERWGDGENRKGRENSSSSPLPPALPPSPPLAPLDTLEGYYQQLEALLLKIGYLYPHTAASRMEKFRRLFNRTYPSLTEVAMLRGILSQMEWALQANRSDSKNPFEKPIPPSPP